MFSLIYSAIAAYGIKKGKDVDGFGGFAVFIVIADLIALNIVFN